MDLEVAETHKRRRYPAYDRTLLRLRVTAVKHVPDHHISGRNEAQRSRCGNAEEVHCFAAKEFADRGAQDRPTICGS
jgi:hypothetical protein